VRLDVMGELLQCQEGDRSVLIVDDEMAIRELCARALKNYQVAEAADGEQALELLAHRSFDVILTDVMMPRLNGLDLLEKVKQKAPDQIAVVMTGFADKEVVLRALKAGADDFLTKPINLLQLKATIDRAIEKKLLRDEVAQLRRMDRLKTDFLGLISHKLKTPTTAISLFIQNLALGIGDPRDPIFQQNLEKILQESHYLAALIEELLFYSEAILQEASQPRTAVDLQALSLSLLEKLRPGIQKKGLQIETNLSPLPEIKLEQAQIRFALRALIDNAIKFTPSGGTITITIALNQHDKEAVIEVRDSGPGIPLEELPKIFEKFYQVDPARTGQVRGFGLGLFYARQFVALHDGSLTLQSTLAKGTSATITLPLLQNEA